MKRFALGTDSIMNSIMNTETVDTRKTVKVQANVKELLEELKREFGFKTESDVIFALVELYRSVNEYPRPFVERLLELRR